jgi:hypothetical protein
MPAAAAAAEPPEMPADPNATPFTETDHIRKFYELARR